ncbi:MAG: hypothetical protein J5I93_01860 [Pirellulaceae bacterium]|nr:hypothetical protein [Pirellulaceae bacterium]
MFPDVNGDNQVSPVDALVVINHLNRGPDYGLVALGEGPDLMRQVIQPIELGQSAGSRTLSFEVATRFGGNSPNAALHDLLLVYLVDPLDPSQTLLDRGMPGTALLSIGPQGAEFPPELVAYDGQRVAIDLTSLADQTQGNLIVQLLNHDGQTGTKALLRALRNEVDPHGSSSATRPPPRAMAEAGGPVNMDWLMPDLSLEAVVDNVRFDAGTGLYAADIRVRNHGPDVASEVTVVLSDLPAGVRVLNASNSTGDPYICLEQAVGAGGLRTGQESLPVTVLLENPARVAFSLQPRVMAPDPITTTRVSGMVVDAEGQPLADVLIELAGSQTTTGADGRFQLEMLAEHVPTAALPVPVPGGDPMFDPTHSGQQSIPMQRAVGDPATGDSAENPLRHPNLVTPLIDASMVYGSDAARARALRTLDGSGKLKTSGGGLLPLNDLDHFPEGPLANDNAGPLPASQLYVAGDVRASENPALSALHTLLVREHNRRADELSAADPQLSDEQLYQHARRWVAALVQHITYQEFLPLLLGPEPLPAYTGFHPMVDPRVGGLFSTGVYRLGHSLITDTLWRLDEQGESLPGGPLHLRDAFFNPRPLQRDGIEPYLLGMAAQPAEQLDTQVVDALRNFLFGPPGAGGLDLVSLNIQRGRDLGLPSYNQLRQQLGLARAESFADVNSDPSVQTQLAAVYTDVNQVDVWVGGLAEDRVPGAMLGELFHTVLRQQFLSLRDGDRFWYENGQLTSQELDELRQTRLSDVILRNTSITTIASHVFTSNAQPAGPPAGGQAAGAAPTEFRSLDGSGNHPDQPRLGLAGEPLRTDYVPQYADQMAAPAGAERPSARAISNALFPQQPATPTEVNATSMLTIWGQLLDHDLSLTPAGKDERLTVRGDLLADPLPVVAQPLSALLGHAAYASHNNVIGQPIVLG